MKDKSKLKNIKFLLILDKATDEKLNSILKDSKITKTSLITNLINEKYYNKDMNLYNSDLEKRIKIDMYNKIKDDIEKEIKKISEENVIEKLATNEELDKLLVIDVENIENNKRKWATNEELDKLFSIDIENIENNNIENNNIENNNIENNNIENNNIENNNIENNNIENNNIENNNIENKNIAIEPVAIKKFTVGGMLDLFEKY